MTRIDLEDIDQLNLIDKNNKNTVVIFKHSTACPISSMMLKRFEKGLNELDISDTDYYYLDIFCYRHISNEIEKRYEVQHESPQLLVIKNGKVSNHASHGNISSEMIITS